MRMRWVFPLTLFLAVLTCGVAWAGKPLELHASDGVTVYGTYTRAADPGERVLLLFHQAGASHHEYDPLIASFTRQGWDTLAIDQRSGGSLFGGRNATVAKLGKSVGYLDAMPDLEAALAWAQSRRYPVIVAVGSSYSSSLVLLLAAQHPHALSAVASFSPGEYFADSNLVRRAAARLRMPVYVTTDPKEEGRVDTVLSKAHGANIVRYRPVAGVHGASTLVCARDPGGCKANLHSFLAFLQGIASSRVAH